MDGIGWKARGDFRAAESHRCRPFFPRLRHWFSVIPLLIKFLVSTIISWMKGREMFIDAFRLMHHEEGYGVPCGGIGSGAIGRDFRGGFCKFSLRPGRVEQHVANIPADQFVLTVLDANTGNALLYQKVLSGVAKEGQSLSAWDFTFPPDHIFYRGLYPRSWTEFRIPDLHLTLCCRQVSPVLPHNYEDCSLPVCLFLWSVQNNSNRDYLISITFTFRNGTGNKRWKDEGICYARQFNGELSSGATLMHRIDSLPCVFAISSRKHIGSKITASEFDPNSAGDNIWSSLSTSEKLPNDVGSTKMARELAIAVSNSMQLRAKTTVHIEFCLVWHMPLVQFGRKGRTYRRRYTRFYGIEPSAAIAIAEYAFRNASKWEQQIDEWQNPILNDSQLSENYKSALFNELYFLTDGGSFWFDFDEEWLQLETEITEMSMQHFRQYGRFGYVESWEYHMVNTYDVQFYAAFAFLCNWPMLELSMQLDFNDQILKADSRRSLNIGKFASMQTKRSGRIPHDLGHPDDEPWVEINAYMLHDTGDWKDLNLKFVISSYRDCIWAITDKTERLRLIDHFYPSVQRIIDDAIGEWDIDGDSMIENGGFPDQTYDAWTMKGTRFPPPRQLSKIDANCAYCGSLWLAALECARRMASASHHSSDADRFEAALQSARIAFEEKLWTGEYFQFDEHSRSRKTIMSDQLCGFAHLAAIDGKLCSKIVDTEKVSRALDTIFEHNVRNYAGGEMGAVNGMKLDKTTDLSCIESEEMWIGTSYALAAFLWLMDRRNEAMQIVDGIYRSSWVRAGLQYQTPEALYSNFTYRAIGYMRPLAIWALQWNVEVMNRFRTN